MVRLFPVLGLVLAAGARSIVGDAQLPLFSETPVEDEGYRIPTIHESVLMARKILHLTTTGTLVTVIQDDHKIGVDANIMAQPSGVAGSPIGLLEYYADCEPLSGNPTLLAIDIATPYRNYAAGSNISMHVNWWPTQKTSYLSDLLGLYEEEIPTPHTPAALPRFSLHGHLEEISEADLKRRLIPGCFMHAHPDSALWQPGNEISHASHYVRLVVEQVYWFGGFGDRARIGWLPIEEWRNATMKEIIAMPLPGEKKRKQTWLKEWL